MGVFETGIAIFTNFLQQLEQLHSWSGGSLNVLFFVGPYGRQWDVILFGEAYDRH